MTSASSPPTPSRFRALARSAPWRWSSIEFELKSPRWARDFERAWVRRPGAVRVEAPDGTVKFQTLNSRPFAGSFYKRGGSQEWHPKPGSWLTDINPARDADGFVERRPSMLEVDSDDVFYRDYHWVAMLDPLELSNCWFRSTQPALPPVEISDVRAVEHHDRRAWQAIAMPTTEYEPRCSCCALLGGDVVDDREQQWKPDVPSTVRLDAETGICVYVEHHGDAPSVELDVRIVAVDAAYPDDLFTRPTG